MKIYVFLFIVFFCLNKSLKAQYVTIPDPNFVIWLQNNYSNCMNGNQMDTTCMPTQIIASITLDNLGISDLTGIQYVNTNVLYCRQNNLTFLPALPPNLYTIDISSNNITHLDNLPNSIGDLYCYNNPITSIANFPIYLRNFCTISNNLSSLPNLPSTLETLICIDNQLVSLPPLPQGLEHLRCDSNLLTSLPTLPNSLLTLFCSNNQLQVLPNLPPNLTELRSSRNQISQLPPLNGLLNWLDCRDNHLTSLPALPSSLTMLYVANNQLTSIPTLPQDMYGLYCENNLLTNLPIIPESIAQIRCTGNQLTSLPDLGQHLFTLICDNNLITCFPTFPNTFIDSNNFNILGNPFTCIPNYVDVMNNFYLNLPLCLDDDSVINPSGCPSYKKIYGKIYVDQNLNCNIDSGIESSLNNLNVKLYDSNDTLLQVSNTLQSGLFQFIESSGIYNVKVDTNEIPFIFLCQNNNYDTTVVISSLNPTPIQANFLTTCKPGFDIGTKSILTNGWVFPGQNHEVKITAGDLSQFYNMNCASGTSGQVQVSISGPVIYQTNLVGSLIPQINGNTFTYNISDFGTTDIFNSFGLIFQTDTTAQAGDQICVTVSVTPELGDNNSSNNLYEFCYEVVNSYDPNMKEVYPVNVEPGFDDYFTYTIHFQNTGSAPAMNIRLIDTLDANLDLETFQMTNYSHYQTANVKGNVLTFHFPNIQLPDSTSNSEGSKGYVQYRIKPKENLGLGTQIKNTANIYFDFNDPIVTNTTVNEYVLTNSLKENEQLVARVYPNPMNSSCTIQFNKKMKDVDINLYNVYGQQVRVPLNFSGEKLMIERENLSSGTYFLEIKNSEINQKVKLILRD